MSTISELIQHCSPKSVSIDTYAFDKVWSGPVASMPKEYMSANFYEAFHDEFGMDGERGMLYVRLS